jgi:hypothetical protein
MAERVSSAQRARLQSQAEIEVMRYADDHYLWHKHVHGVELDPVQILKQYEMDKHPNTIDVSCRRTRKTTSKELYNLKYLATHADQELGIVAPRQQQASTALGYHIEAIERSDILKAWLRYKNGRKQMSDSRYQFCNRSLAQSYGIMSQIDGGDLTLASLDEVDDMPHDRLHGRFLPMLGASQRLGADPDAINDPQIRITGVFKGADTLQGLIDSGGYHLLPPVDRYLAEEMGIAHASVFDQMASELTPDEYLRQVLCKNVSGRNLIWESHMRRALQMGLRSRFQIAQPMPGAEYRKRGLLSFGYDAGGHGERPESSRHCLIVTEQVGMFLVVIFCKFWPAAEDDEVVKRDLLGFWRYFRPDEAIGDAFAVGMLSGLNDKLFSEGLTTIDRRAVGDGESTSSTWKEWPFSPLRFDGMTKHQMARRLAQAFSGGHVVIPYFDDHHIETEDLRDLRDLCRQLVNIKEEKSGAPYSTYKMVNRKIGDDGFDAMMAAAWALDTRGADETETCILTTTHNRQQLLAGHG